jgi:hypothetical protein
VYKRCSRVVQHLKTILTNAKKRVDTSQHIQYGSCAFLKKYAYIGNIDDGPPQESQWESAMSIFRAMSLAWVKGSIKVPLFFLIDTPW